MWRSRPSVSLTTSGTRPWSHASIRSLPPADVRLLLGGHAGEDRRRDRGPCRRSPSRRRCWCERACPWQRTARGSCAWRPLPRPRCPPGTSRHPTYYCTLRCAIETNPRCSRDADDTCCCAPDARAGKIGAWSTNPEHTVARWHRPVWCASRSPSRRPICYVCAERSDRSSRGPGRPGAVGDRGVHRARTRTSPSPSPRSSLRGCATVSCRRMAMRPVVAGVGPMAAVAGAVAEYVARGLASPTRPTSSSRTAVTST